MYGCETWVLPQKLENALRAFERQILRRIFGPVSDNGRWRIRYNHEMNISTEQGQLNWSTVYPIAGTV
jgi:hypothetical protein